MVRPASALEEVPAHLLAREPHLDPRPGHGLVGHGDGHQVVEGPVEVRQRHVHEHPGHRVDRGRLGRGGLGRLCASP